MEPNGSIFVSELTPTNFAILLNWQALQLKPYYLAAMVVHNVFVSA
jgi:hypothetical protein